jgi:biofilm PGA synthesis protein PgaA
VTQTPGTQNRYLVPGLFALGLSIAFTPTETVLAQEMRSAEAVAQETGRAERDAAVVRAREGDPVGALGTLLRLRQSNPGDATLRGDLAAVLHWAGRDAEAVAEGEHLPFGLLEPIIAESVARAARNVGRPALAVILYEDVLRRDATRVDSQVGLALAHLEAGNLSAALERVRVLRSGFGDAADARMAAGHVLGAAGRWVEAAAQYRGAGLLRPEWQEPRVAELVALREAGADGLARSRAEELRGTLPPVLLADLTAGRVARLVEWSPAVPISHAPSSASAVVDRAVDASVRALDEVVDMASVEERFPELRIRFDRLLALREREDMARILEEAHALEAEGIVLPPYALRVVADAALAEGDPVDAERRYRATLAGWPDNHDAVLGLFWTLVELRAFGEADRLLAEYLERQPTRRTADGLREPLPNPDRLAATLARHLGWAMAGDLARAQAGLEALHGAAPLNLDIRQELASVYNWRGWSRQADDLYLRILALDPEHVPARIGRISAALAMDERPTAVAVGDTLRILAPRAETTRQALRRVDVDALWILSARYGQGRSTGGDLGTRDRTFVSEITTAPLAHRVRFHVGSRRADADYPEGRGAHDRVWAGISVRSRPVVLRLETNADRDGARAPGVSGEVELRGGEGFRFRMAGDSRSEVLPIRATLDGIRGWAARTGLEYRSNEGRWMGIEARYLEMTDGNERMSAYAALEQQVARSPAHRVALRAEGYGALNSRDDAPYFNPSESWSGTGSLVWDWFFVSTRDRRFLQRVVLTGGAAGQADLPTLGLATATLDHTWEMSDRLALNWGVHGGLPVYDGIRERRLSGHLGFTWRAF